MPMEDTYGIQSRIGSIIVVERWYCCRGSPVFSDRNIHLRKNLRGLIEYDHIKVHGIRRQKRTHAERRHQKAGFDPLNKLTGFRQQ